FHTFFFYCFVPLRYLHSFPTRRSSDLMLMVLGIHARRAGMMRVHRQRNIEQHPRSQMRGLVGLNVMHHRVHVEDDHVLLVPNCGDEGQETAVPGLDGGRGEREWLASWHLG